jgi:hypothetical protein
MQKKDTIQSLRHGYSLAEFAGMYGKSTIWAYRQYYAGRLKVIEGFGARIVPYSEVVRLEQSAAARK